MVEPILDSERKELSFEEQQKTVVCAASNNQDEFDLLTKFSSWNKLKRVVAWCFRFVNNANASTSNIKEVLIVLELNRASNIIVRLVRRVHLKRKSRL
ncbi:hypothetical protein AVEN_210767-1 [Araneus ventricosus]|uniref:Uncharacterized protein n=1 Tax=Araneus ventricosus TaxID=182803 RepID=A0A4Y2W4F5_ARAVE|nr:hypothetical protein AVEN_210767-1 [Araneus ventricosus]